MDQDDDEDTAISDFLNILDEHRKNCEQQGKYIEAEIAKKRLDELKAHEEKRQDDAMRARHISDMLEIEESHMVEFKQFNIEWDQRMKDYESHSVRTINNMKDRQEREFKDYREKLVSKNHKPKFSSELLKYRQKENLLVKSKNYGEAQKAKEKADELEDVETKRWELKRQEDFNRLEMKFKNSKRAELQNLEKRLQTGKEEQKIQRKFELERLLQRYQNLKKEMEAKQSLERNTKSKRKI